jgi:hypothetical protein
MGVSYLLDGPLMALIESRTALIQKMAKDLIRDGIPETDQEAARMLFGRYPMLDAALLAGEARMLAYQEIVAAEMSKP